MAAFASFGRAAPANAIAYSVVQTTWGWGSGTAILGSLGSGGIGATSSNGDASGAGTNGATVYVGNTSGAGTGTHDAEIQVIGTAASKTDVIHGTTVIEANSTSTATGTYILNNSTATGRALTMDAVVVGGSTTVPIKVQGGGTATITPVTATNQTITSSIANGPSGTASSLGVQGVENTLSGASGVSAHYDFTCAGTTASCGTNPVINTGRNVGYFGLYVSGSLTTDLVLHGRNASDYVFVYLAGGIGAGGAITIDTAGGSSLLASHVIIVVSGANSTLSSGVSNAGTYIVHDGYTLTMADGATLDGGVFLSNTSTTAANELIFAGAATITADPWNGWIASSAPEPGTLGLMAIGLAGLAGLRRRCHGAAVITGGGL